MLKAIINCCSFVANYDANVGVLKKPKQIRIAEPREKSDEVYSISTEVFFLIFCPRRTFSFER